MPDIENTVDVSLPEAVDDAQQNEGESLTEITGEQEEPKQDAGWFKQRIDKAVNKAVSEANARIAEYEARIAQLESERVDRKAQELVDSGEFKSLETAREYLTLKSGRQPMKAEPQQESDPVIQAKADMLAKQAQKIKSSQGLDVMAAYNQDSSIQQRIASGEWDFYDVAEYLQNRRNPPSPARSSNGARSEKVSIKNMSEKQWQALQANLGQGKKYSLRD